MNPHTTTLPRFWIGICLVTWGVFTDQIILAIAMAVIAEFGRFSPIKYDLVERHFYRVADLSSVLFAIVAVYQFNEYSIYGIYRILALLPVCVFPLLVAERYSTIGGIPLSALFLSLRRRVRAGLEPERYVGMAFPYVIVCTLAASAGDKPGMYYLASTVILIAGALFTQRIKRYQLSTWALTIGAVTVLAFALHTGVRFAQRQLEDSFLYWVNQFAWFQTDPNRAVTAIGSIGRLKLSDRIRVRVKAPLSTPLPIVLHEASYSKFNLGMWSLAHSVFVVVDPAVNTAVWNVGAENGVSEPIRTAKITIDHARDVGVVPLPYGISRISGVEVIEVQRNQYGTTLIEALPGQLEYGVSWGSRDILHSPPTVADVRIPDNYSNVITQVAMEIGLQRGAPHAALAQVVEFFRNNYKYSLIQKDFYPGRTPLAHFLLQERKGHCEYFATATVLLLRHAGIPARYAVGYIVDEYSPLEKAFIARARHAHSWTEAFVDGRWTMIDTTPSEWYGLEQARASNWQYLQDLWSWLSNHYERFRRTDHELFSDSLIWLVPPLVLLLLWRLRSRARSVVGDTQRLESAKQGEQGMDSDLYVLFRLLREKEFLLLPGDTLKTFLNRNVKPNIADVSLMRLIELHYRYRFATMGLSALERKELRAGSEKYCARLTTK